MMSIEKIIMDCTMNQSKDQVQKQIKEKNILIRLDLAEILLEYSSVPLINNEIGNLELVFGIIFVQILKQSQNQQIRNQFGNQVIYNQQLKDIHQQTYIALFRNIVKIPFFNTFPQTFNFKTLDDSFSESFIGDIYINGIQSSHYQSDKFKNKEPIKYKFLFYHDFTTQLFLFSTNNMPQQMSQSNFFNQQQQSIPRLISFPACVNQQNNQIQQGVNTNSQPQVFSNQQNKQFNQTNNINANNQFNNNTNNNLFNSTYQQKSPFPNFNQNIQNNFNQFQQNSNVVNNNNSCKNNNFNSGNNNFQINNINNPNFKNNQIFFSGFNNKAQMQQNITNPSFMIYNNNQNNTQQKQGSFNPPNTSPDNQNLIDDTNMKKTTQESNNDEVNVFMTQDLCKIEEDKNNQSQIQPQRFSTKYTKNDDTKCCDICCQDFKLNTDEALITPCCNNQVHKKCMLQDLNEKAKQNLCFKRINCFVCSQSLENYENYLKKNINLALWIEILKIEVLGKITLKCCNCKQPIQASSEKKQIQITCQNCNTQHCSLCYQKYHGQNEKNQQCPSLLSEIQKAIKDMNMPIVVCPFCNLTQSKDDGCNHVTCFECKKDLCSACSADRFPILQHGNHYHREGCIDYKPWIKNGKKVTDPDFDRKGCSRCKETNQGCQYPISLEEYKKLKQF